MFNKILIANRGEIALRIIKTCKEMGINTVAVYSTVDKDSLHVRFADEAVCIGPPPSGLSYLNIPAIISAAEITNADAIHPGYGFLSENADFAEICADNNIKFIGASPENIRSMGNKSNARKTMKKAGIPIIPGSDGLIEDLIKAKKLAKEIGYPVLLKASAGGGGKGMRISYNEEELEIGWKQAKTEALAAFNNDNMYMEKFIVNPRHIEVQIIGDSKGNIIHLSERDCSIQRRYQKLVEETPSPAVDEKLREKIGKIAIQAGKCVDYQGLGTVEFLLDADKNFYFMEMNTRVQVEHPITEEVVGFDLVKKQIQVAAGKQLKGVNYYPKMYSMECRINAEDPFKNFRPTPGIIEHLHKPDGQGVRVDSHIYAGYKIPPNYDSLLAKLIITARTREEVIIKMLCSLEEFTIEGVKTTIPLLEKIMKDKDFKKGEFDTHFMNNFKI